MIRLLQTWDQVGDALLSVQRRGWPAHESAQQNWDHGLLLQAIEEYPKTARLLDLGCGNGFTLRLLATAGYQDLVGTEMRLRPRLRLSRYLWLWRNKTARFPYKLRRGDFNEMEFPKETFDITYSISAIEHGIRLAPFMEESHRVLKPGGLFFLTADYWDPKIHTGSSDHAFGRAWYIFAKEEIERLLFVAEKIGFALVEPGPIPTCTRPMMHWQGKDYTAIALLFRKLPK